MKEVIREGVFETNSSSAHFVTLKKYDKTRYDVLGKLPDPLVFDDGTPVKTVDD